MGFFLALVMIGCGALMAGMVLLALVIARKERERSEMTMASPGREAIVTSILWHVAHLGGADDEEALRLLREGGVAPAPITRDIDLPSWAVEYARISSEEQRRSLIENAVRIAVIAAPVLPLRQYNALLELNFGLGFQTDTLARLRARYRFDLIDHARNGRPRSADRSGGGAPLYVRGRDLERLTGLLELDSSFSRRELVRAYRRTAAVYHPDRVHDASPEQQRSAAERFIAATEAYEQLLPLCADD
jgi:hypothetical protein